jgi:hypothetical protein
VVALAEVLRLLGERPAPALLAVAQAPRGRLAGGLAEDERVVDQAEEALVGVV